VLGVWMTPSENSEGSCQRDARWRTHEIGVRFSLGATRSRIIALVLRGAVGLLVAGTLTGFALSLALSKLVSAHLYGVSPRDVTVAVAACDVVGNGVRRGAAAGMARRRHNPLGSAALRIARRNDHEASDLSAVTAAHRALAIPACQIADVRGVP